MTGLLDGRVAVITGAGRGIGREHALLMASRGAKVVVNDLGGDVDGSGGDASPAQQVVNEIRDSGGEAVVNGANVADFADARAMIDQAITEFGGLDILINNAGILRDRMVFKMEESDWDAVINVHLKGTFAPTHHAAVYWREQSKAGNQPDARVINTSSPSGIYGNVGQSNYGAAKAGIASFTMITAMELANYGVTCNAIAPAAFTRMTENLPGFSDLTDEQKGGMDPRWIANLVTWLASPESASITGRIFDVVGDRVGVAEGWVLGPQASQSDDPEGLGDIVRGICNEARLNSNMFGQPQDGPGRPTHS
ncbi:MAG: SDR family NAD(P)-dependent oxidoreductase [Acidimicrobiales bacterium]|nr:SDR family NAD(P)-dependent oxidoreductase [Acidimicrobiales bacterium]RZV44791.1 MAG: SDR family NAD(P)-dependent oxidoreductase [Acidimicrobiales bacterium]